MLKNADLTQSLHEFFPQNIKKNYSVTTKAMLYV